EEGACDVVGVLVGEARAHLVDVFAGLLRGLDLPAEEDVDGALPTHDGDLGGRPRVVDVGAELLGAHDDVGAAVRLAGDDGDEGHGGLRVRVEQFGAAADDAGPLLVGAGKVPGNVDEGEDGDGERVAESH